MPRATTTRKPRTTRTKKDVDEAFNELTSDIEGQETLDPQAAQLASEHAATTRSKVSGLSVDTIVKNAATLNLQIGRTFNELTEQCVQRAQELKTIQDAIEVETKELERLYGLDVASASITLLVEEHTAKKAAFEKEADEVRQRWNEEFAAHEKATRQAQADLQLARKREEDTYEYNKRVSRSQREDEFARKMATQERELADKAEAFEKEYTARREAIEAQERDLEAVRARIAGIDEEIKKAVTTAEKILTNVLTKDFNHEKALLVADWSAKLSLEQQKSTNLAANNEALAKQVLSLTAEVKAAHEKIAETAKEALQSASGQMALSKVMESQASSGSPNGGSRGGNKS